MTNAPTPKAPPTPGPTPDPRLAALREKCQAVLDADEACCVDHPAKDCDGTYRTALSAFHSYVPAGTVLDLLDALAAAEGERDAYRKAKQENDERFLTERDEARNERDALAARAIEAENANTANGIRAHALATRLAGAEKRLAWFRHTHEDCEDTECMDCGVLDCPNFDPLHHHHDGCPTCSITPDSGYTGDFDPGAFVRDCGRNAPEAGGEGRGTV